MVVNSRLIPEMRCLSAGTGRRLNGERWYVSMKKRQLTICAVSGMMAAGMLTGCSGSSSSSDSASAELNFWFPTYASSDGDLTDEEFWAEVLASFEEENNCTVNVEIVPWDSYEEKYLTGINSNDGPDVGYLYMEMFYDYIDMGAIVDIDEYFTDEEKENYLYWDLGNIQDGQYALPVVVGNPRLLLANMDILNEAGITEIPSNWDELVEACQAIQESNPDIAPIMQDWGNPHYGSLNEIFWPYFWGAGGDIVDDDGNLTIDTDAGLEATEFLYSLMEDGYLPSSATSNDDTVEPFKNGETAMIIIASSNAAKITDINWDFTVLSGPADTRTFVAADSLVLFDSCENKELAAELMKYVTSAEVMSQFHEKLSSQPPITADEEYAGDERFAALFTDEEYTDTFQTLPVFKGASSLYDTLFKNLQSMMLGEMTPAEVLSTTTEYYNENLK